MCAIAINTLYTTLRRRGTTQQLAGVIVACVISALLLLPAIVWYNVRFSVEQAALPVAEVEVVLAYVALCGWLLPLTSTIMYGLFTVPRISHDSARLPNHHPPVNVDAKQGVAPSRPTTPVPFVFGKDTPWGWLEYRGGRFHGQRLKLTQALVKIGREEDNDIWLDDETASRYHAELIWSQGRAYITDLDSRNGVLLNGQTIHGSTVVMQGTLLSIGVHCFLFEYAEPPATLAEQDDPLLRHARRAPNTPVPLSQDLLSLTKPSEPDADVSDATLDESSYLWQETAELDSVAQQPTALQPDKRGGAFVIRSGEMEGKGFLIDRPVVTIGRGIESDVIINDLSISRRHAQVSRQANGDYVQDLDSRNGTKVNDELLEAPRLLQHGDIVCVGDVRMEYTSVSTALTTPLSPLPLPARARSISGPIPLRLPSKPRTE